MKQVHRKAIIAALAGAGLLAGNMAFGATDYMELQANARQKSHMSQKSAERSQQKHQKQNKQRNQ